MKSVILTAIMLLPSVCWSKEGRSYAVPPGVGLEALAKGLRSQGFRAVVETKDGRPSVVLDGSEAKDPTALIESLIDVETRLMRDLAAKWSAGTITPEEKDRLLLLLVKRVLGL